MQHVAAIGCHSQLTGKFTVYLLFTGNCIVVYWQSRQWDGPVLCPMCRRQVNGCLICVICFDIATFAKTL